MNFKSVISTGSNKKYADFRPWKMWAKGDFLIGKYKGEGNIDKQGNPTYQVTLMETSFGAEKGLIFSMNHTKGLGDAMANVEVGETVKVVYQGMAKNKAGKDFHKFDVMVDAGDTAADDSDVL